MCVTTDYKTREPVGTFTCKCGFRYSRKLKDDIYKIGRIKCFGPVWEEKLKELIIKGMLVGAIAKEMECDRKTVIKYSCKLGLKDYINTNSEINYVSFNKEDFGNENIDENKCNNDILTLIPKDKRTIKKRKQPIHIDNYKYWEQKDMEILNLLKIEYEKILKEDKLTRITMSLLGKRIHKSALLYKKLDKLPKTSEYLAKVCETVEQFQIRRVIKVCEEFAQNNEKLIEWKIMRKAGLTKNSSKAVKSKIEEYVN